MCGIAGFWGPTDPDLIRSLSDSLCHRGPDDEGSLTDACASIASRRLSILDIAHGHQPMSSAGGRLHLTYNGEVYNFRELRADLEARGHRFTTTSDTEVVLKAYEADGAACFARFNGMFALALLDQRGERPELVLARDQFGIKPLYHTRVGERLLFSSEIKSFFRDPAFRAAPNDQRVEAYLRWGLHDHDGDSFFAGVRSLPPASYAVVRDGSVEEHRYWEPQLATSGDPSPERFRELFTTAVERRLVADVRVGTCLSGGLDSSSIVCTIGELLRRHAPDTASIGDRLATFSAVFPGDPIDEREWMDTVLAASGADGNFVAPSSTEFIAELGDFAWYLDEPIVSSGPYAQWRVMRLARGKVKVLLDGQAGDELLAGYVPYQYVYLRQLLRERRLGRLVRESLAARDVLLPLVRRRLARQRGRRPFVTERYLRPAYRGLRRGSLDRRVDDDLKRRLLQDLTTYSLPSLLRYEDRNSMAHSIEARVPFLDLELVEHVLSLPAEAIIDRGWSRAILRRALQGLLPERIRLRRKKIGFTTPEMRWLRAERAAVVGVFRSPAFASRPYWDGPAVSDAFEAACDGRLEESLFFWRALNLELWLRVFVDRATDGEAGVAPGPEWPRIGDRVAARLLGDAPRQALGELTALPGRHLFQLAADAATVYARAPLGASQPRSGDIVAARAAEGTDPEALLDTLSGELGPARRDGIGLAVVAPARGGATVVAVRGVDPRLLAPLLRDDPFGVELGAAVERLIVRPAGRWSPANVVDAKP